MIEKYEADEIAEKEYIFQEGIIEGELRGELRGELKIKKRDKMIIEKMIKRGDSIGEIADFLEIPIAEVEEAKAHRP